MDVDNRNFPAALADVAGIIEAMNPGKVAMVHRWHRDHDGRYFTVAIRDAATGESPTDPIPGRKSRRRDSRTAKLAAIGNAPRRGSQRARIISHLVAWHRDRSNGLTAFDLGVATGLPLNSVSTRMSECERGGWVQVSGTTTQSGAERSMYVPTQKAIDWFAEQL